MRAFLLLGLVVLRVYCQLCQTKPGGIGATCSLPTMCNTFNCKDGKCAAVPIVGVDQDCDGDYKIYASAFFLFSSATKVCDAGLECHSRGSSPKCTRMPKIGEPCESNGVNCIGSFCANDTRTCTPFRSRPNGAACTSIVDCQQGLICTNSKCAPAAKLGEACSFLVNCEDGLGCSNGKCYTLAKQDETCGPNVACADELFCDTNLKCARVNSKTEGAACASDNQCQTNLVCFGMKCIRPDANCTVNGCAGSQLCECPGNCVGNSLNFASQLSKEVAKGNRNFVWLLCQGFRALPSGYVDSTIVNLVCTASASAIKASIMLMFGILLLFLGVAY